MKRKNMQDWKQKACSKETLKNRLPVTKWIPNYNFQMMLKDILAGIAVGATTVAQGIAYADIAGLPTEYGLYSGLFGGFIYFFFGNCKNMFIGPTAIISALVTRFVQDSSPDFAVLLAFLAGIVQLILAVFQLGFLVEFLSVPVVAGFTSAAAIQVFSSQFKSFFGYKGTSGSTFIQSVNCFFENVNSSNLWDTILGCLTVICIMLLKKQGEACTTDNKNYNNCRRLMSLIRNVIVIIVGMLISYVVYTIRGETPFTIVGDIYGGLPEFKLPPFTTSVGNITYNFMDMIEKLGPQSLVVPFVAIMEVVIISKAFTPNVNLDATQEIFALGLCNVFSSFVGGMPITGAFSRSALLEASCVETTAAGVIISTIIVLSLTLLTSMFYFIPKPSLAGMIMVAVFQLIETKEIAYLWNTSKREFAVLILTMLASLSLGLEYGVILGVFIDVLILLYRNARPHIHVKIDDNVILITLPVNLVYCSGDFVRKTIVKHVGLSRGILIILEGSNTRHVDSTVVSNVMSTIKDMDHNNNKILFLNFNPEIQNMCLQMEPKYATRFKSESIEKVVLESNIV